MTEAVPVSRFGHVELEDMPDDLRARVGAVAEKSGFVPNVFRALARRPAELRAFLDYHDALMDFDDARAAGLSDDEIWDVGAITALFAMSNRLAHLTALRPNPEFYLMGRVPRT